MATDLSHVEIHPIDIVETLAENHNWEFDRVDEDQIAMLMQGSWSTYSLTLAWHPPDETLRLVCTFEMDPPVERRAEIAMLLDKINDLIWSGCFTSWSEQKLMVYRYGLVLAGGAAATSDQIDTMIRNALEATERFYPAFQLVGWGNEEAEAALKMAVEQAFGRA